MIEASETFDGTFPFEPHFSEAPGFRMHYVDEGAGEPMVLLHGEPTWGYLYRNFVPPLSKGHRVIVPDHMGFGKSETPQDREYRLWTHVENLSKLIDELGLEDITLVGQDWGGPIAGAYAVRNVDRIKRICLMNTVLGYGTAPPAERTPWFTWVAEQYEAGTYEPFMSNLGSSVLSIMKRLGFRNSAAVDDNWIRAYAAPFQTKEECKGAIEFPLDVHLQRIGKYVMEGIPNAGKLEKIPAMLAEGMLDKAIAPEFALADFKALYPDGPVVQMDEAGHFCQEDEPKLLVALIQQFCQMTK